MTQICADCADAGTDYSPDDLVPLSSSLTILNVILDAEADRGINFLDTADFYPMGAAHTQLGCTEEITGRWLKGKRHRFIVASKAGRR